MSARSQRGTCDSRKRQSNRLEHVLSVGLRRNATTGTKNDGTGPIRRHSVMSVESLSSDSSDSSDFDEDEPARDMKVVVRLRGTKREFDTLRDEIAAKRKKDDEWIQKSQSTTRELSDDEKALILPLLKMLLLSDSISQAEAVDRIESLCRVDKKFRDLCRKDRTWTSMYTTLRDKEYEHWNRISNGDFMKCVELIQRRDGYDLYDTKRSLRQRVIDLISKAPEWRKWLPKHFVERKAFEDVNELKAALYGDDRKNPGWENAIPVYGEPEAYILSELPFGSILYELFAYSPEKYWTLRIGAWDLTNVIFTAGMFERCTKFNSYIGHWNMENVEVADSMFCECNEFDQDISRWDTGNLIKAEGMFQDCWSFNQDLSGWNTENLENCSRMFERCGEFNQDIGGWNMNDVTEAAGMFYGAGSFNQDLSRWRFSPQLTNLDRMFCWCTSFNTSINDWDVRNVVNMDKMFKHSGYNQPLDKWRVEKLVTAKSMFKYAPFNQPINDWLTLRLVLADKMFEGSQFDKPLNKWITRYLYGRTRMFYESKFLHDISMWWLPRGTAPSQEMFDSEFPDEWMPRYFYSYQGMGTTDAMAKAIKSYKDRDPTSDDEYDSGDADDDYSGDSYIS